MFKIQKKYYIENTHKDAFRHPYGHKIATPRNGILMCRYAGRRHKC